MKSREQLEKQLIDNRLMQNEEAISLFEEAMDELFQEKTIDIIPIFIKAFDDNTEDFEVMFGMIHGIEALDNIFGLNNSINTLFQSVSLFREEAEEWAETIFIRILNNEKAKNILKNEIDKLSSIDKSIIISILSRIKEEDKDEFEATVNEVLSVLKNN
jgi:hypothetical protein